MPKDSKQISLIQAFIPITALVIILFYNVFFVYGDDALSGSNQFVLLIGMRLLLVLQSQRSIDVERAPLLELAIGIGGDPIIGTTTKDALELLINDQETDCVVMIGEIGGQLEGDAAKWYKKSNSNKPVVGFIAGETAPAGRTMGHAGAIVGGSDDTAQAKKRIMRECGIHVVNSPAEIGKKVAEVLAQPKN